MNQNSPILVKFSACENYIGIRTITRQRKSPQSFDIPRPSFTDLESARNIFLQDGNSFADMRLIDCGATVQIDFTWLSRYSDGTVKGYVQTVYLDYDALYDRIWESMEGGSGPKRWSMLSEDRTKTQARLDFNTPGAQRVIREILAVPVLRHKLTRAVRDNFRWPNRGDITVRFYSDFDRYSFTFQEYRGPDLGICGGLILHHHDGLAKAQYSVHT